MPRVSGVRRRPCGPVSFYRSQRPRLVGSHIGGWVPIGGVPWSVVRPAAVDPACKEHADAVTRREHGEGERARGGVDAAGDGEGDDVSLDESYRQPRGAEWSGVCPSVHACV